MQNYSQRACHSTYKVLLIIEEDFLLPEVRTAAPGSPYSCSIRYSTVTQQPFARVNSVHHEWACVHMWPRPKTMNGWSWRPLIPCLHSPVLDQVFTVFFFLSHPVNMAGIASTQILPLWLWNTDLVPYWHKHKIVLPHCHKIRPFLTSTTCYIVARSTTQSVL